MEFWSQLKNKANDFSKTPDGKQLKVIIPIMLAICFVVLYLVSNPIVLSITYDDGAYDNYSDQRKYGCSFYSTDSRTYYTTHGIDPFCVEVNYLFAPSEDLWEAFDNGNITVDDLDRLDFDYWSQSNKR